MNGVFTKDWWIAVAIRMIKTFAEGCLDGLKQQGCNGRVTDACDMLDKHINKAAHDQD